MLVHAVAVATREVDELAVLLSTALRSGVPSTEVPRALELQQAFVALGDATPAGRCWC